MPKKKNNSKKFIASNNRGQ